MDQDENNAAALGELATLLADLKEAQALELVRKRLASGDDPIQVIEDCQAGMREVGERYVRRQYYLAGLIMAGEILREIMEVALPAAEQRFAGTGSGRILVGTVQGDIHDLGKNLLLMLLRSHGFAVLDLGVDVAPEVFVAKARSFKPHVIGLSVLIAAAHQSMRETVSALQSMMAEDGVQIPIVVGGKVDEEVCRFVGADYWSTDAMDGVRLFERLGRKV
jgi:methylmalonyl-CoA mutase cobalamin-binding domain/chain